MAKKWEFGIGDKIAYGHDSSLRGKVMLRKNKPKKKYLIYVKGKNKFSENVYFSKGEIESHWYKIRKVV